MTEALRTLLFDVNDFIVAFRDAIELSIPHIYISGLANVHFTSEVACHYKQRWNNIPRIHAEGISKKRNSLLHLRGHTDGVTSVAFSADGRRIVSGSCDTTVRVWDSSTGHPAMPPLEGHTDRVTSVAFSPDGRHIVSGSWDETIRVWDASTGHAAMSPLEGHAGWVSSVAFSPDGRHIVSGSEDKTIRVWDTSTGHAAMPPLEGHTSPVNSVAFSPDGSHIASGSADKAIRVWDASTGHVTILPREGHDETITSVAGSRDEYPSSAAPSIFGRNQPQSSERRHHVTTNSSPDHQHDHLSGPRVRALAPSDSLCAIDYQPGPPRFAHPRQPCLSYP
ncbi:hypothetical protein HGRIS_004254 [Hohenbuehelia grisea]|uniref:WD40 repeat-like protein n=1 Tax=Hohenbuehelia grisea TaxID=104357 RepID=A0ABR3IP88_9AGAR